MADNHFKVNRGLSLVPQSAAPANPGNGDIYYDSGLSKFRKYQNGAWSDLDTGGSGGTGDDLNDLNFRVSISEDFSEPLATSAILDTAAGKTDATLYNALDTYMRLAYDASKTITAVGTAVTVSGTPAFTVKTGDMIQVAGNDSPKRITAVASQTSYTVESAWTTNPTAAAACISQAVHTVDLNNYAADGLAPSAAITDSFTTAMVDYEDSSTADDIILDLNVTPHIAFSMSVDGSTWTTQSARPTLTAGTIQAVGASVAGTNLYLRFFANKTSGSGFVNLLGFKAYWQATTVTQNGNLLNQAYCISDGSGVEINCTVAAVSNKTRVTTTFAYVVGLNPGTTNGQLEVYVNGQKLPRYIDATLTPNGYYKEIDAVTIELDSDYTAAALSIEIVKAVGVVDSSNSNTTRITALESRSPSVNYIVASDAENTTTGWNRYVDAAGLAPIDGTGGSPAAGTTFGATTSSPLRSTKSFILNKDASNRQGEGVSYDFTIDRADLAKVLSIEFDYETDTNYANNDVVCYIYDITNAVMIQPAPYQIFKVSGPARFKAAFQSASNSTSYRLVFHVSSTSALAYSLKLDRISVGPTTIVQGTPVTDEASTSLTITGFGTVVTPSYYMSRIGDRARIRGVFQIGTVDGNIASISLPPGLSIDSSKFSTVVSKQKVGDAMRIITAASGAFGVAVEHAFYDGSDVSKIYITNASGASVYTKSAGNVLANSSEWINFDFTVPILGWSSNVLMSSDADTRVVAFSGKASGTQAVTDSVTNISLVMSRDTHAAWTGSTYVVPVAGDYVVQLAGANQAAAATRFDAFVDGVSARVLFTNATNGDLGGGSALLANLRAGQVISFRALSTVTLSSQMQGSIFRLSGPAQIAASEKVFAQYTGNAGGATSANVTNIDYTTKVVDSHGAWNGTTFTAPRAGWYDVKGALKSTANISAGTIVQLRVNGTYRVAIGCGSTSLIALFSGGVYLNAGDVLSVRTDGNPTLSNDANQHSIAITSQG